MDDEDMDRVGTIVEYWGKQKGIAYFKKLAEHEPSMRRGHAFEAQPLSDRRNQRSRLFGYRVLELIREGTPMAFCSTEGRSDAA